MEDIKEAWKLHIIANNEHGQAPFALFEAGWKAALAELQKDATPVDFSAVLEALDETYRFASTSPRSQENINFVCEELQKQPLFLHPHPKAAAVPEGLEQMLIDIAEFAHDKSTGPAVPDALWQIREWAYEALDILAAPSLPAQSEGEQK